MKLQEDCVDTEARDHAAAFHVDERNSQCMHSVRTCWVVVVVEKVDLLGWPLNEIRHCLDMT